MYVDTSMAFSQAMRRSKHCSGKTFGSFIFGLLVNSVLVPCLLHQATGTNQGSTKLLRNITGFTYQNNSASYRHLESIPPKVLLEKSQESRKTGFNTQEQETFPTVAQVFDIAATQNFLDLSAPSFHSLPSVDYMLHVRLE